MDSLERYLEEQGGRENPMLLEDGVRIGNWYVRGLIGRGGTAEVYRAEHVDGRQVVAIKVLREQDGTRWARFLREARLLRELPVASFPRFLGLDEAAGRPCLVEELLEPGTLPHTDAAVARYLLAVCRGVAELHRRGIVHRDLKPGNILFRADGAPVIVDLGLAKRADARTNLSVVDGRPVGVGTPGYAAPEQFLSGASSAAVDIHALGVLADACFGGRPPRCWAGIIDRATSSLPARRYATVAEFAAAIRRRHARRWFLVAAAGLVLAAAATFGTSGRGADAASDPDFPAELVLGGATNVYSAPVVLKAGHTYRVTGPGLLDADLSGPTNALLVLKNCFVVNRTRTPYPRNGLRYRLDDGVYLNFAHLDGNDHRRPRGVLPYDGGRNVVRFRGGASPYGKDAGPGATSLPLEP